MKAALFVTGSLASLLLALSCADYDLLDDPDRQPDPVTLEIVAVTDSSVTVRWTQCDDEDFKQYALYYGTDDIVDRSDKLADSLSFSVDTVKTVRPLDDQTRYYFRVIVFNDQGNFSASNIVDTVTPEDMKGKLKLAVPALVEGGTIRLTWSKGLEAIDRYNVYADTTRSVDTTDTLIATVYSDTAETVAGLQADHTWWFRVYARRDTAVVATSNIVEFRPPIQ